MLSPLSYIGATFVIIFSLLTTTELINLKYISFIQEIKLNDYVNEINLINYILGLLILNSFVACFYKIPKFFDNINRYTLGLYAFSVYTEIHIHGIRVFKVSGFKNSKLVHSNIFDVYNEEGRVVRKHLFKPSVILGLTYRITDICERRLGKISTQNDEKILTGLFNNIIDEKKKR